MSIQEKDLQGKVESIIENYMRRTHRKSQSIMQSQNSLPESNIIDQQLELMNKQFQKTGMLNQIYKLIENLIESQVDKFKKEVDTQIEHLISEISTLKQMILNNFQDSSQKTCNRSENNSFSEDLLNTDTFYFDDNHVDIKQQLKNIKDKFEKRNVQQDQMINKLMEQQIQLRSQIDISFLSTKIYDQIWQKIDSSNKVFAEQKFEMFKKVVDDLRGKIKEKQTLIWNVVAQCENNVEQINKRVEVLEQRRGFFFR